ncbi:MAG: 50S ribosomal protein L1 [Chlamydiia bacterium]|nr:50S ribosomal protein L1 [Chlamydiia bacterium]
MKHSKRMRKIYEGVDKKKYYSPSEAIDLLKSLPHVKFDESVEVALRLGIDPKKSDQAVRSTVVLPHGTGKQVRILVICKGDKVQDALDAGATYAGAEEYIEKIKGGWTDFDAVVASPDLMREVGILGKVLGPRGLMPTPKAGTVTPDVAKAVTDLLGGKIDFRADRQGVVNAAVGKLSFGRDQLVENLDALLRAIQKVKPATAKGVYMRSLSLSSTMGPGVRVGLKENEAAER